MHTLKTKVPRTGFCFRFVGDDEANGVLMRVVIADPLEVIAVQESSAPRFSWAGTVAKFWQDFVFIMGPAPSYHRQQ